MKKRTFFSLIIVALWVSLGGCGGERLPDNSQLIDSFQDGRTGIWLGGHGTVQQIFADETAGTARQRFSVRISSELTVMLRHNLDQSARVPVERGDVVAFHGRYEWDGSGGSLSRTHADPGQPGGGGWIMHQGRRYD